MSASSRASAAFDLGLERAGFRVIAQVELDPFCQRVLARRWPDVPRVADVRAAFLHAGERTGRETFHAGGPLVGGQSSRGGNPAGRVDLLVGGFPCQDLSVAGKRAGLAGTRSSLFHEYVRIAQALQPTYGLVENVPGLISSHRGRDFWVVLQGLRECWPVVGWRVLDSQHFGVPQRRRRVFVVGGPTEQSVAEILALTAGGGGDSAAGGQAGTDVASGIAWSSTGPGYWRDGFGPMRERDYKGGDQNLITFDPTAGRDDRIYGDGTTPGLKVGSGIGIPWAPAVLTHALTGEGHDASEDGTGRGTPLVAFKESQSGVRVGPLHATLDAHKGSRRQEGMLSASSIRRLTPLECERLQGFPDGWTCTDLPLEAYAADPDAAALACTCPDSPRYRALGNAVTVPVIQWLGQRLRRVAVP